MRGKVQDQLDSAMRYIAAGARCLLWYADVREQADGRLQWSTVIPDEEAAQRFLPLDLLANEDYGAAWFRSRLPEESPLIDQAGDRSVRSGSSYQQEYRCRDHTGEIRWLSEHVEVETLDPGHWRVVGVSTDVTDRRRHEDALRESEARLRLLVRADEILASSLDFTRTLEHVSRLGLPDFADWCIVDVVEAGGEVVRVAVAHRYPEMEETLRQLQDRFPPSPESPAPTGRVLRTGQPELLEAISDEALDERTIDPAHADLIRRSDLRSHLAAPMIARGEIIGVINFGRMSGRAPFRMPDMALAQSLASRAALAIDNARLYRDAQQELAERRRLEVELLQRAEALSAADRQKDEFLAMLAHELRNPLGPILNAVEILQARGSDDSTLVRQREVIRRQSQHIARLLDDLLDVSRITRNRVDLRRQSDDLCALVEQAVESCRSMFETRKQQLVLGLAGRPVPVFADPVRIEQVVENLLRNASRYTPSGGGVLVEVSAEDDSAVLRVRDSGVGIEPDLLPRIWELFTQGERSLARPEGGLGIGLTIVKRLVDLHGGTVTARSEGSGRGTEFEVRLPLDLSSPMPTPAAASQKHASIESRRVLVVEDNPDAGETLQSLLELWGHQSWVVPTADQAIELASEVRPHTVLLDIGLPGMDGYALAREFRRMPAMQNARLIAVTGYGQEEDRLKSREAGIDHHLTKPVDHNDLRDLINADPAREAIEAFRR